MRTMVWDHLQLLRVGFTLAEKRALGSGEGMTWTTSILEGRRSQHPGGPFWTAGLDSMEQASVQTGFGRGCTLSVGRLARQGQLEGPYYVPARPSRSATLPALFRVSQRKALGCATLPSVSPERH